MRELKQDQEPNKVSVVENEGSTLSSCLRDGGRPYKYEKQGLCALGLQPNHKLNVGRDCAKSAFNISS